MKIKMIFGTLAMAIIVSVFVSCGNSKNGTINDHDYVDLGLSVKWATCNIGASHPEEFGGYYSWGENSEKDEYNEKTYKWCNGSIEALTKYVDDPSVGENVDNIAVLELADDAAYANWGKPWRMPTAEEWQELFANCRMEFTKLNGIDGVLFTSMVKGFTEQSIFLPAAGSSDSNWNKTCRGEYWSSSTHPDFKSNCVSYLWFYPEKEEIGWTATARSKGLSIRPVADYN